MRLVQPVLIQVTELGPQNEINLIYVDGELDTDNAPELGKVIDSLMEKKRYNLIIDLGKVNYISSTGWAIFTSRLKEIRQNRGDLKLVGLLPDIYEVFELLEFHRIFSSYSSVEDAVKEFLGNGT